MDLTRRELLLAGAGGLLVAACGKGTNGDAADATSTTAGGLTLFKAFPAAQPVGTDLRLPLGLAGADGSFDVALPPTVAIHLLRPDGTATPAVTVARHQQDLPRGYFPLQTTFDVAGRWTIVMTTSKATVETTVDAKPAGELPNVPGPGDPLPRVATPTVADHQGVNPICTRDPACPFHQRSLDQAIGGAKPIVLLVSTPAFCQVAICGPVLDLLVTRRAKLEAAGLEVIHAEVYTDDQAKQTTATVDALGLTYEPSLFLAAPDGTVDARLDSIFDGVELDAGIANLIP